MAAADFHLVSEWRLAAPVARVWSAIAAPEEWPQWWRAVEQVETIEQGDARGVGALRRIIWRTALPYKIALLMRTTKIELMRLIEVEASGELRGIGQWTFAPDGDGTRLRYDWRVAVEKPWMRLAAPLLRPVFAWNHGVVMRWGEQGLARRLAEH
jgi:uncharacterized protein YndB with AHSA1/START domain